MWLTATVLNPFDFCADAVLVSADTAATRAMLFISWRRVILPRSKSSSSLAMMLSIFFLPKIGQVRRPMRWNYGKSVVMRDLRYLHGWQRSIFLARFPPVSHSKRSRFQELWPRANTPRDRRRKVLRDLRIQRGRQVLVPRPAFQSTS